MPKCDLKEVAKQYLKICFFGCLVIVPDTIIPGPRISFKHTPHNHLRCPMMREVSVGT